QGVVLVMIDLSAAFDTIDHDILLRRLQHVFGITGVALKWLSSYLTDRHQSVVIDGMSSKPVLLRYGVPQGSVLGPKLYTMYTQPLGGLVGQSELDRHFYADDAQLYESFELSANDALSLTAKNVEECVLVSGQWLSVNKLSRNDDKTEVIVLVPKHAKQLANNFTLKVGDSQISSSMTVRNLGVIFDTCMSMEPQVNSVCRSAYAQLRNIGKIRRYLTPGATKALVHGLVTSRLDYCNSLLYGVPKALTDKLQRVQNTAARIITRTSKFEHITPVLQELHWLPVTSRVRFKVLLHTYKALHGHAPEYLVKSISVRHPQRALRSASAVTLTAPRYRTQYGSRSFSHSAAVLWNALPMGVRNAPTISSFVKLLKTLLFAQAYGHNPSGAFERAILPEIGAL
ncbi:MAG: hypothetical protein MJA29_06305, partial [Candidatus Omnitrophica bacterium]|nr:hypothetical protein [Candidatus Omnitrophota bacterium]